MCLVRAACTSTAASFVLDMEQEDLQVMMISRPGETAVDAVIFDPMPGGSGLLEQILSNWETIVQAATEIVDKCPSECESGCVDCLYTFRNAFYHRYLNRKKAAEIISINGAKIKSAHDIPALMPQSSGTADSTNKAEDTLKDLLIRAGFPPPVGQKEINLGAPLNITTPDFYYEIESGHIDAVCIYLDGLSKHIHGNPATRQRDIEIRTHLKNTGYEVIEIAYSQLSDKGAMANYFYRLGRIMLGRDKAAGIKDNVDSWFEFGGAEVKQQELPHCQIDSMIVREPVESDKYVTCLPFYPLEIAAGYFGEGSSVPPEPEFWMRLDVKKISKDMFVSKITGKSMEPKIPDGSYCLFRAGEALAGSRNDRFIVIRHSGINDPETGFSFTLKKYKSEKQFLPDGSFRHVSISLKPLNADFNPIELKVEEESDIKVVAEFLQVVK